MITQADIDALKRIREHCEKAEDCEGCEPGKVLCAENVSPCFWILDDIKIDNDKQKGTP